MRSALFIMIFALATVACKKDAGTENTLTGQWEMVAVKETGNVVFLNPYPSIKVQVNFQPSNSSNGTVTGHTSNVLSTGSYTITTNNGLALSNIWPMTNVAETTWTELFVQHINHATSYHFSGNSLNIVTSDNRTLVFHRS